MFMNKVHVSVCLWWRLPGKSYGYKSRASTPISIQKNSPDHKRSHLACNLAGHSTQFPKIQEHAQELRTRARSWDPSLLATQTLYTVKERCPTPAEIFSGPALRWPPPWCPHPPSRKVLPPA